MATRPGRGNHMVFEYKTLQKDQIRILQLNAGDDSIELSGTLQTFTLKAAIDIDSAETTVQPEADAAPTYSALSYCWGHQEETKKIWLSHIKSTVAKPYLLIKPNLDDALRKLRRSIPADGYLNLWSDAICINQSDILEKNGQIQKMADIYSMAEEVHIWLGNKDGDSDLAMQFANEIKNLESFEQALKHGNRHKELVAFGRLMHRPWFSRRWIVQEISLARLKTVHCGNQSVSWDDMEEAISIYSTMHTDVRKEVRSSTTHGNPVDFLGEVKGLGATHLVDISSNIVQRTIVDQSVTEHRMSLEGLMSTMTMFETGNPYDVLYALLWLAHDVKPDAALSNVNVRRSSHHSPTRPSATKSSELPSGQGTIVPSQRLSPRHPLQRHGRNRSVSDVLRREDQKHKEVEKSFIVDYNSTLFQCYKNFLEHVFQQSQSLDIICRAWALAPRKKPLNNDDSAWKPEGKLPSWIQILDEKKRTFGYNRYEMKYERIRADPLVGRPGTGPRPYSACGKRRHEVYPGMINEDEKTLQTRGFALGSIIERDEPASDGNIPETWLHNLGWTSQPLGSDEEGTGGSRQFGEGRPSSLWRFLVAERGHDGYEQPPMRFRSACTWLLDRRTADSGLKTNKFVHDIYPSTALEFLDRTRTVVWGRRLVVISHAAGSMKLHGLAPKEAIETDIVCILYGCSVPVVLRKVSSQPTLSSAASTSKTAVFKPESVEHHPEQDLYDDVPADSEPRAPTPSIAIQEFAEEHGGEIPSPQAGSSLTVPVVNDLAQKSTDVHDLSGERYELIGECFVYGMMSGEGFQHREDNQIKESRLYTLC